MSENSYVEKIKNGSDVVLYGVSENGFMKYQQLKSAGVEATFFWCDTESAGGEVEGMPILSLCELYAMDKEKTVVFVYSDTEPIAEKKERLELAGFKDIGCCTPGIEDYYGIISQIPGIRSELKELFYELFMDIYFQKPPVRLRRKHNSMLILAKIMEISEAYNLLADEESRDTFRNILQYRVTGNAEYLKECAVYPQYFMPGIYEFSEDEVYVDAGAAQGDSILAFIRQVNGKYGKIYGFEAKKSYRAGMSALFANENVEIIPSGLHEKPGKLYFHEGQHGSKVSTTVVSANEIDVTSLDAAITGRVSFIKMDIEGSEIPALKGGVRTIQENKPKLAICAYHLEDDLWNIPILIKKLVPEYKIYMRQHYETVDWETVCYATL